LWAAFDSVDRGVLMTAMRKRENKRELREEDGGNVKTRSRVRVGNELGREFWTAREIRQGCPASPVLFNILMVDLEEEMNKIKWRGIRLEEKRIFADDVV